MNREIKFRAWQPDFKALLPNVTAFSNDEIGLSAEKFDKYAFKPDGRENEEWEDLLEEFNFICNPDYEWYQCNATVMQYTGLKDKNGIEIYEGDILQDKGMIHAKEVSNLTVEFRPDTAAFAFKEIPNSAFFCVYAKYCEVIGNIYQHAELIPDATHNWR